LNTENNSLTLYAQDTSSCLFLFPIKGWEDKLGELIALAVAAQCCKSATENDRHGGRCGGNRGGDREEFLESVSGLDPFSSTEPSSLLIDIPRATELRLDFMDRFGKPGLLGRGNRPFS